MPKTRRARRTPETSTDFDKRAANPVRGGDGELLDYSALDLTPVESLALLRCRVRENYGGIWRDVKDTEQIKNTLAISEAWEIMEASNGDVDYWDAHEKAEIVIGALVDAYISAKVKISLKTGAPFDLKLPGHSPAIEMLQVVLQRMKDKREAAAA